MSHLTVVGGVHGAGKSTLCAELLAAAPGHCYLTNQEVRREAAEPLPRARVHAILRERAWQCFGSRTPFLFEHVMSGRFVERLLAGARAHGFSTHLVYLDLPDAAASLARVRGRLAAGGHDVERDRIASRLHEGRRNFWLRYRLEATTWLLYDASGPRRGLLAAGMAGRAKVIDEAAFGRFECRVEEPVGA